MTDFESRIAALPLWGPCPTIEPLLGGLSNVSFAVTASTGKFVVRFARDFPFHGVDRVREVAAARAAHAAGFAPEVVHAAPGITVSRFIEGHVLAAADVRSAIAPIASLVRGFHAETAAHLAGAGGAFDVFAVIRQYAEALRVTAIAPRLREFVAVADELEAAQVSLGPVFGHHDLLPANLIDDGTRLWLIDFEYAAFGTPMFDLANLSSNAGFDADQSMALLEAYFGRAPASGLLRAHAAMACASLLREALWSLVSEIHLSAPGADYAGYARTNLERFDAALAEYRARFV